MGLLATATRAGRRLPVRPLDRHSSLFAEIDRILREQIALGSRRPGRLYAAIAQRGIVEAVTSAVATPTSGFQDLVRIGRLDLAMEWVVLDPRWKFPAYVRATAHARLRQAAQQRPIPAAIGEAYACRVLRLTPAPKRFQRDYDATDAAGAKYQIKARTVTSLAECTSFDFKRPPSGFDHFVGVLVTPRGRRPRRVPRAARRGAASRPRHRQMLVLPLYRRAPRR
jgi:hypothetical protein